MMKTLTLTDARARLGYWLGRAGRGEEIGVIVGDAIFAFRRVPVTSADYAEQEYGLTPAEVDAAAARIVADTRGAKTVPYVAGMLSRGNSTDKTVSRRRKATARR